MHITQQLSRSYRSAIARVIVPAPATVPAEPRSHIIRAVGHAGSLWVGLAPASPTAAAAAAAEPQMPH